MGGSGVGGRGYCSKQQGCCPLKTEKIRCVKCEGVCAVGNLDWGRGKGGVSGRKSVGRWDNGCINTVKVTHNEKEMGVVWPERCGKKHIKNTCHY